MINKTKKTREMIMNAKQNKVWEAQLSKFDYVEPELGIKQVGGCVYFEAYNLEWVPEYDEWMCDGGEWKKKDYTLFILNENGKRITT